MNDTERILAIELENMRLREALDKIADNLSKGNFIPQIEACRAMEALSAPTPDPSDGMQVIEAASALRAFVKKHDGANMLAWIEVLPKVMLPLFEALEAVQASKKGGEA